MPEKGIDVVEAFNNCRELVKLAEKSVDESKEKQVNSSLIPPLIEAFEKIVDFTKSYLITAHDPLYGMFWMNSNTEIDVSIRRLVDIDMSSTTPNMRFNPLFCKDYTWQQFVAAIVSEILAVIYEHPATYAELNKEADKKKHSDLEKGSEASISSMIKNDIRIDLDSNKHRMKIPDDMYTVPKLNNEINTNVSPKENQALDYYYRILEKYGKNDNQEQNSGMGLSKDKNSSGQGNQNGPATQNNNSGKNGHQWEKLNSDDVKENTKSIIKDLYDNMTEKQRGFVSGGVIEQIKKILKKPEINWKQILRKFVGAVPVPYRKTRKRLNRRQPYRADLCGRLPKRVVNIVVAIDTSGSMSNRDIMYCMNEIFNIVKGREAKITIIECDAEIGDVYQVKKIKDVHTKVTGRGGTSYIPVIEFINGTGEGLPAKWKQNQLYGRFRDALMIYFTDGYGDDSIPKPRTYRNMWVVLNNGDYYNRDNNPSKPYLSVKNPYGEVKSLKMDQDWIKSVKENDMQN